MSTIYSRKFISEQGLNGNGMTVTVPAGHVYIVKQLSNYAASTVLEVNTFFRDLTTGAAIWRHNVPGGSANWGGDYGARVFEAGDSFRFEVVAAPVDQADVYAAGYDLTT